MSWGARAAMFFAGMVAFGFCIGIYLLWRDLIGAVG